MKEVLHRTIPIIWLLVIDTTTGTMTVTCTVITGILKISLTTIILTTRTVVLLASLLLLLVQVLFLLGGSGRLSRV